MGNLIIFFCVRLLTAKTRNLKSRVSQKQKHPHKIQCLPKTEARIFLKLKSETKHPLTMINQTNESKERPDDCLSSTVDEATSSSSCHAKKVRRTTDIANLVRI